MRRKVTFTVGVFVEELLFKSGVRNGQDLGQVERGGIPKEGPLILALLQLSEFQGGALSVSC